MPYLHWSVLAIVASFFWGWVNLADKIILARYKVTPWDYLALDGFVGFISLNFIFWGFGKSYLVDQVSFDIITLSAISGIALAAFSILYFYALRISDVAVVVLLIQITPVFSLLWGITFLKEVYKLQNYFGMILVFISVAIASLTNGRNEKGAEGDNKVIYGSFIAALVVIFAAFIMSLGFLFQKFALERTNAITLFFWQRLCLLFVSMIILVFRRNIISKLPVQTIYFTSAIEIVNLLGVFATIAAYSQGPLGLVSFLGSLQPLWVIAMMWILMQIKSQSLLRFDQKLSFRIIYSLAFVVPGLYFLRI